MERSNVHLAWERGLRRTIAIVSFMQVVVSTRLLQKDMIVSGGENVYSAEVENALSQHPAVAVSAVIGIPSDQWGEAVHAVVLLKPEAGSGTEELATALIAHCRQHSAGYKCPRSVAFRTALPMTGAGKIQKTELRKPFWEGKTRAVN
jgi:acyl-CoA synthetase (AMP-forming)/AMP-acid ligase II